MEHIKFFNTAAFGPHAPGTFGHLGRNILEGPGLANTDLSIFKAFPMPFTESHRLEFRAEFFNALNRVNFSNPTTSYTSAVFGQITAAGDPRILQFGLRYAF